MSCGKDSLCLFTLGSESSQGSVVVGDIDTGLSLEHSEAIVNECVVEIFSSQVSVSISCLHFKYAILNSEQGDIESATSQIEDQNIALLSVLFVQSIGDSCGGWFVNDSGNVESGDGSSILGGLSLRVIEICWHSDYSLADGLAEVSLGDLLHLD